MDIVKQTEQKMVAALEHLKTDLKALRTNRANPGMVENVMVEAYGALSRLKDIALISAPEARQIVISPYDKSVLHAIAKGIEKANLNIQPIVDGDVVRIKIPQMDASVRQEIVKQAKKKCEESKVAIRNIRRDQNDDVKKKKSQGDIAEDQQKKLEKNIQDLTDKYCKMADEATSAKEKEILTV